MVLGDPIGRQFLLAVILQLQLLTFSYADALRQFPILPAGMIFAKHYALKLQQTKHTSRVISHVYGALNCPAFQGTCGLCSRWGEGRAMSDIDRVGGIKRDTSPRR
jgi:hypothetical protein